MSFMRPITTNNGCTLNLVDAHKLIIQEIEAGAAQKDVAKTYALGLRSEEGFDYKAANEAILKRWSPSGLVRIKEMAWSGKCFDSVPRSQQP